MKVLATLLTACLFASAASKYIPVIVEVPGYAQCVIVFNVMLQHCRGLEQKMLRNFQLLRIFVSFVFTTTQSLCSHNYSTDLDLMNNGGNNVNVTVSPKKCCLIIERGDIDCNVRKSLMIIIIMFTIS